jgi:hypothetical protein
MPRSDNGRLASLKKRLEAFFERQIHERDEFGNSLAGVSEPVLRKAIDALCTEIPSLERIQVERAAEVAKKWKLLLSLVQRTDYQPFPCR